MNEDIMRNAGFNDEMDNVNSNKCPFCGKKINFDDFEDELSLKEFIQSGICQHCQNDVFSEDNESDDREYNINEDDDPGIWGYDGDNW